MGLGVCVLVAPELVIGAVIVVGVVVVAAAIKEELDAYELSSGRPEFSPAPETRPAAQETSTSHKCKPERSPAGEDWLPPAPPGLSERERSPRCKPIPVPHRGGDDAHDRCADTFPPNRHPGMDVLVAGKQFDALQVGADVLWEIKTDQFDTYSKFLRNQVLNDQLDEFLEEGAIARRCGYDFVVGVSSAAHKRALLDLAPDLGIHLVVTGCKR
jgi:hypothetical protein